MVEKLGSKVVVQLEAMMAEKRAVRRDSQLVDLKDMHSVALWAQNLVEWMAIE